MSISISELERIEREMTPGEWRWDEEQKEIRSPDHTEDFGMGPEPVINRIVQTDGGYYQPETADAIGICAMRNAFPVLLRIARAAKEAAEAYEGYQGEVLGDLYANRSVETMDELIGALKAVQP